MGVLTFQSRNVSLTEGAVQDIALLSLHVLCWLSLAAATVWSGLKWGTQTSIFFLSWFSRYIQISPFFIKAALLCINFQPDALKSESFSRLEIYPEGLSPAYVLHNLPHCIWRWQTAWQHSKWKLIYQIICNSYGFYLFHPALTGSAEKDVGPLTNVVVVSSSTCFIQLSPSLKVCVIICVWCENNKVVQIFSAISLMQPWMSFFIPLWSHTHKRNSNTHSITLFSLLGNISKWNQSKLFFIWE